MQASHPRSFRCAEHMFHVLVGSISRLSRIQYPERAEQLRETATSGTGESRIVHSGKLEEVGRLEGGSCASLGCDSLLYFTLIRA